MVAVAERQVHPLPCLHQNVVVVSGVVGHGSDTGDENAGCKEDQSDVIQRPCVAVLEAGDGLREAGTVVGETDRYARHWVAYGDVKVEKAELNA